jgi:hypothetical protein
MARAMKRRKAQLISRNLRVSGGKSGSLAKD